MSALGDTYFVDLMEVTSSGDALWFPLFNKDKIVGGSEGVGKWVNRKFGGDIILSDPHFALEGGLEPKTAEFKIVNIDDGIVPINEGASGLEDVNGLRIKTDIAGEGLLVDASSSSTSTPEEYANFLALGTPNYMTVRVVEVPAGMIRATGEYGDPVTDFATGNGSSSDYEFVSGNEQWWYLSSYGFLPDALKESNTGGFSVGDVITIHTTDSNFNFSSTEYITLLEYFREAFQAHFGDQTSNDFILNFNSSGLIWEGRGFTLSDVRSGLEDGDQWVDQDLKTTDDVEFKSIVIDTQTSVNTLTISDGNITLETYHDPIGIGNDYHNFIDLNVDGDGYIKSNGLQIYETRTHQQQQNSSATITKEGALTALSISSDSITTDELAAREIQSDGNLSIGKDFKVGSNVNITSYYEEDPITDSYTNLVNFESSSGLNLRDFYYVNTDAQGDLTIRRQDRELLEAPFIDESLTGDQLLEEEKKHENLLAEAGHTVLDTKSLIVNTSLIKLSSRNITIDGEAPFGNIANDNHDIGFYANYRDASSEVDKITGLFRQHSDGLNEGEAGRRKGEYYLFDVPRFVRGYRKTRKYTERYKAYQTLVEYISISSNYHADSNPKGQSEGYYVNHFHSMFKHQHIEGDGQYEPNPYWYPEILFDYTTRALYTPSTDPSSEGFDDTSGISWFVGEWTQSGNSTQYHVDLPTIKDYNDGMVYAGTASPYGSHQAENTSLKDYFDGLLSWKDAYDHNSTLSPIEVGGVVDSSHPDWMVPGSEGINAIYEYDESHSLSEKDSDKAWFGYVLEDMPGELEYEAYNDPYDPAPLSGYDLTDIGNPDNTQSGTQTASETPAPNSYSEFDNFNEILGKEIYTAFVGDYGVGSHIYKWYRKSGEDMAPPQEYEYIDTPEGRQYSYEVNSTVSIEMAYLDRLEDVEDVTGYWDTPYRRVDGKDIIKFTTEFGNFLNTPKVQYRYSPTEDYPFEIITGSPHFYIYQEPDYTDHDLVGKYRYLWLVKGEGDQADRVTTLTPEEFSEIYGGNVNSIVPLLREFTDDKYNPRDFQLAKLNAVLSEDSKWKGQKIEFEYIDEELTSKIQEADTHRGRLDNPHNVTSNQIQDFDDNVSELLNVFTGDIRTDEQQDSNNSEYIDPSNPSDISVIQHVGVIDTGVWQGDRIDAAYLDLTPLNIGEGLRPSFDGVNFTDYSTGNFGLFNTGLNFEWNENQIDAPIHVKTLDENAVILERLVGDEQTPSNIQAVSLVFRSYNNEDHIESISSGGDYSYGESTENGAITGRSKGLRLRNSGGTSSLQLLENGNIAFNLGEDPSVDDDFYFYGSLLRINYPSAGDVNLYVSSSQSDQEIFTVYEESLGESTTNKGTWKFGKTSNNNFGIFRDLDDYDIASTLIENYSGARLVIIEDDPNNVGSGCHLIFNKHSEVAENWISTASKRYSAIELGNGFTIYNEDNNGSKFGLVRGAYFGINEEDYPTWNSTQTFNSERLEFNDGIKFFVASTSLVDEAINYDQQMTITDRGVGIFTLEPGLIGGDSSKPIRLDVTGNLRVTGGLYKGSLGSEVRLPFDAWTPVNDNNDDDIYHSVGQVAIGTSTTLNTTLSVKNTDQTFSPFQVKGASNINAPNGLPVITVTDDPIYTTVDEGLPNPQYALYEEQLAISTAAAEAWLEENNLTEPPNQFLPGATTQYNLHDVTDVIPGFSEDDPLIDVVGGRVGINVANPLFPLEVRGTVYIDGNLSVSGGINGQDFGDFSWDNSGLSLNDAQLITVVINPETGAQETNLSANTKRFVIDHPTKKGKKLQHGSLEGSEYGVYSRGKSKEKIILLPEYWTKLIDDDTITIQLTPIGKFQQLWVEKIESNMIFVGSDQEEVHYYFFINAERKDVSKLEVEI